MRVVIDTGVAISAVLLPGSVPRQAFDAAARSDRLLISQATIAELDEVLRRPKFDKYLTEALRLEFLAALVQIAEVVEITEHVVACRDADDDKFLSLAVGGKADYLISGDQDLLILHPFRNVSIITPTDYLALRTAS
jgi:putative toxin-antitoxin system toxin component, PIN family